ncbi:hypothetical protein [Ekhidna sp.]|uniref:hypothetical protein n=1 Tax=Ekhidna sp. TaxID=2608089 RepID=UPI00329830AD
MKHKLTLLFLLISIASIAQKSGYEEDAVSVESLTSAYYDCVSGPIGQTRDFDRLRNLFHSNAQLTYSYWSEEEQKNKLMHMDIEEYIEKLDYLDKKGFYEEELFSKVEMYGSIVQTISTYKFWMEDKSAEGRGFSSYNLFYDGNRYWILSMFWMMESKKYPIPDEFLD